MTIEQLLKCSADELERMTDEELKKHFEPYLKITRPELAEKPAIRSVSKRSTNAPILSKKQKANMILQQLGIDLRI